MSKFLIMLPCVLFGYVAGLSSLPVKVQLSLTIINVLLVAVYGTACKFEK
jgi:hypothetical protein